MLQVSIVIVSHDSGASLPGLLADLERERELVELEVIVVDNASIDGGLQAAEEAHPWVRPLANRANLGFARASNQGLRLAAGRYLMILNPDIRLRPGSIKTLAGFMDQNPDLGAVGPRIVDPDGEVQYSARSAQGPANFLFNRYSLLTRLWPDNPVSRRYLLADWDHDTCRRVDWLSGAALMVRREVVERVGLLDEAFFLFHEDVDWCKRIGQGGFEIVFCPLAQVSHEIGISKERGSVRLIQIRHQSMIHYVHKHYRRLGPLLWLADLAIGLRFGWQAAMSLIRRPD